MKYFLNNTQFKKKLNENKEYYDNIKDKFYSNIIIANSIRKNGKWYHPFLPGYETIIILTKSYSKWGLLGPYSLKINDIIFENYWQFSKFYKNTNKVNIRQYGKLIWSYPETEFTDNKGLPNENYWKWRKTGFENKYAVRYPVSFKNMNKCLYAIPEDDKTKKYNYIEARKNIYFKKYIEILEKSDSKLLKELEIKIKNGKKIIICEVDGFYQSESKFYKNKYPVLKNEPLEHSMINITNQTVKIMLNEEKKPAGHSYPIAMYLKNIKLKDL